MPKFKYSIGTGIFHITTADFPSMAAVWVKQPDKFNQLKEIISRLDFVDDTNFQFSLARIRILSNSEAKKLGITSFGSYLYCEYEVMADFVDQGKATMFKLLYNAKN